ncbi:MAG: VacJ family lipoprotein [Burkholderiales bacterium]
MKNTNKIAYYALLATSRCARLRSTVIRVGVALMFGVSAGCANVNPRDPIEPYNRVIYSVNDAIDRNVLKPVSEGYKFVVPRTARVGVRNFFANLEDVWIGTNNLLQLKIGDALSDWMRVVLNSTFGIAGLYDVASDAGLEKHNEDFGQTLGWWGVPSGPYLVLPLFGPSTFRDAPALFVDSSAGAYGAAASAISKDNANLVRFGLISLHTINRRADALEATTLLDQAALDRYTFMRDAFLQRRQSLVYDGDPPREKESNGDTESDNNAVK